MVKLNKETVLPLAAMMAGGSYDEAMKQAYESLDWSETTYGSTPIKGPMTKKQVKARNKSKAAKKARKKNRK